MIFELSPQRQENCFHLESGGARSGQREEHFQNLKHKTLCQGKVFAKGKSGPGRGNRPLRGSEAGMSLQKCVVFYQRSAQRDGWAGVRLNVYV